MNKRTILITSLSICSLAIVTAWLLRAPSKQVETKNLGDEALLALIKNDLKAFENFINSGGDVHHQLPMIEGRSLTIAQGMAYFERPEFIKFLQSRPMPFVQQNLKEDFDILSLSVEKNNPELLELLIQEKPDLKRVYGAKKWNLLHLASANCSHNLVELLHEKGGLNWSDKTKDGETALTLAAERDCLPVLSYWKEKGANFKTKDGRGKTALSILKKKKDAALSAFAESFEERKPASIVSKNPKEVNFYRKRKIPKEKMIDYSALIEPEIRPEESVETAEFSEFSD